MKKSIVHNLIVVCCIFSILPMAALLASAQIGFLWIYLIVFVLPLIILTVYMIVYIRKRIIHPLSLLADRSNKISTGDLSCPIEYSQDDELGRFIASFEHMRKQLYEQQREQQQFEIERKNFISSISHDLKTPIASISAYVEALQDGMAASPEEEKQYLKVIGDKLNVMSNLSSQLQLSYSIPKDLGLVFHQQSCFTWSSALMEIVESECRIRGIHPVLDNQIISDNQSQIWIDRYQLDRAVQNILSNALRYAKEYLAVSVLESGKNFVLKVENDGVILLPEMGNRIFDRFYTGETHNEHGHLGLGLYIAKTIIHAMEGEVRAKIIKDKITFEIISPIVQDS
jgi:signal transduction histidine kinase